MDKIEAILNHLIERYPVLETAEVQLTQSILSES